MFTVRQHADSHRFFILEVDERGLGHHEVPAFITQVWANRFAGSTPRVIADSVSKQDAIKAMTTEEVRQFQIERGDGDYAVVVYYLDGTKKILDLSADGKLAARQ